MTLRFLPGALDRLARSREAAEALDREAEAMRDRARRNARPIAPHLVEAIIAEPAEEVRGELEARVGYDKRHPGFVLWWAEVGTSHQAPQPHLRPAIRGRSAQ